MVLNVPRQLDDNRAYTISETCVLIDINRNTLRRWTNGGLVRCEVRKADNKVFYRGRELRRLIQTTI